MFAKFLSSWAFRWSKYSLIECWLKGLVISYKPHIKSLETQIWSSTSLLPPPRVFFLLHMCWNRVQAFISSTVRLVNGTETHEGRVEVFHNGSWGTVCDDSWGIDDARVVCRSLGYRDALSAPSQTRFGQGSGPIWMDNVQCSGNEAHIFDCPHNGFGNHDCSHGEDASVVCLPDRKHIWFLFVWSKSVCLFLFNTGTAPLKPLHTRRYDLQKIPVDQLIKVHPTVRGEQWSSPV